jgi:hypothetical protein
MATIIRVSGEEAEEEYPKLERLNDVVGGTIDGVRLPDGRRMFVNDEGLILGLPLNKKASTLARQPIVGDVVVLTLEETRKDEEP